MKLENLDFYLKRLHYYHEPVESINGFGEIPFVIAGKDIQWTYDFWKQGMIEYITRELQRIKTNEQK